MGSHDHSRVASRFGSDRVDGMMALLMTLPGVAVTYYGDEIGMVDYRDISWEDTTDPQACNLDPKIILGIQHALHSNGIAQHILVSKGKQVTNHGFQFILIT